MILTDIELRVLGVLIEKSLTQPAGYPMTMNAVTLGCNQKQNRDPVVEYTVGDVARAIHTLSVKGLVRETAAAPGARVNRYTHCALDVFKWDRRQQAVMAELMIRGRQTAGELRTHASRMTPFTDLPAVTAVLNELKTGDRVFVEELPREPGRSANRFRHLLAGDAAESTAHPAPAAHTRSAQTARPTVPDQQTMEHRVRDLEQRLAALEVRLDRLESGREPATSTTFADSPDT